MDSNFSTISVTGGMLPRTPLGLRQLSSSGTTPVRAAFDRLKGEFLEAPILANADFDSPFQVYVDGRLDGLGAVLSQVQDGQERVIAYASRSLHPAERNDKNYSSFKLELLGLKWALEV